MAIVFVDDAVRNKGKCKGLDTCYSATYMSRTRDQQRFKARSHMTIGMTTGWQTYANYLAAHWLTVAMELYQWS